MSAGKKRFKKTAPVILLALTAVILLTGCGPTVEELHQEQRAEIERQAELAQVCRDSGGRYLLTTPPGKVSSAYWCIWDEEREGGEW